MLYRRLSRLALFSFLPGDVKGIEGTNGADVHKSRAALASALCFGLLGRDMRAIC